MKNCRLNSRNLFIAEKTMKKRQKNFHIKQVEVYILSILRILHSRMSCCLSLHPMVVNSRQGNVPAYFTLEQDHWECVITSLAPELKSLRIIKKKVFWLSLPLLVHDFSSRVILQISYLIEDS